MDSDVLPSCWKLYHNYVSSCLSVYQYLVRLREAMTHSMLLALRAQSLVYPRRSTVRHKMMSYPKNPTSPSCQPECQSHPAICQLCALRSVTCGDTLHSDPLGQVRLWQCQSQMGVAARLELYSCALNVAPVRILYHRHVLGAVTQAGSNAAGGAGAAGKGAGAERAGS